MYQFKEQGHQHLWDGKRMTGVTTILGVIAKPALLGWAVGLCADYARSQIRANKAYSKDDLDSIFEEAKKAHTKKKEQAADIGTLVHSACELFIKENKEPELDEQGMKMFENFRKWVSDNNVKFLESEKHLYSEELFLAGIVDAVVEIDGQKWIMDIKTSSGIYAEAFFQMGGYEILMEKMGIAGDITGYIVVNLRKDGSFEEKRSISNEDNKQAFMSAYNIYKTQQKINSLIK